MNIILDSRRRAVVPQELCEGLGLPRGEPVVLTAVVQDGVLHLEPVANALARVQTQVRERAGQGALVGVPKVDPALAIQAACVVDASAVLSLLRGEAGHELLAEAVATGKTIHMSAVSLVGVEESLLGQGFSDAEVEQILAPLGLEIAGYSVAETKAARAFAGHDLDVGTRAALALAAAKQVPLVSAVLGGDVGGVVVRRLGEEQGLPEEGEPVVAEAEAELAVATAAEKVVEPNAKVEPAEKAVAHEIDSLDGIDFSVGLDAVDKVGGKPS